MIHNDPNLTTPTVWAGVAAFIAGLTLNEIAAFVGIVVALGTFGANIYFQKRRDRRETVRLEFEIGKREERRSPRLTREDAAP